MSPLRYPSHVIRKSSDQRFQAEILPILTVIIDSATLNVLLMKSTQVAVYHGLC